jgi:hypothetical protein
MSTVAFAIVYAQVPGFPVNTTVASQSLIITKPDGTTDTPISVPVGATSASYTAALAGNYTASLQALDANNNPLGTAVNAPFTVSTAGTTVSLSLPSSLTATVST